MSQSSPDHLYSSNETSSGEIKPLFTQRVIVTDSYMSDPSSGVDVLYSEFRGTEVKKVPVIRIFGVTPQGQKVCAHIHGVFPYLYIIDDESSPNVEQELAYELDKAINETFEAGPGSSNNAKRFTTQHVFKIIKVSGRSLYGYRSKESTFLKIYFYNPWICVKAAGLFQKGKIFGRPIDTYESHIPFILQFFMDFCIFGMNLIHFTSVLFRREFTDDIIGGSSQELEFVDSFERYWDLKRLPDSFLSLATPGKTSHCELEIDVIAANIIVQNSMSKSGSITNPGIESIWEDERARRTNNMPTDNIGIPESQAREITYERLPAEAKFTEALWNKVLNYKESKLNSSKGSQNELNESSLPPASQIHHFSCSNSGLESSLMSQSLLEADDDGRDFLEFLEEMAANRPKEDLNTTIDEEEEEEEENADGNEIWNDSFMSPSLEAFLAQTDEELNLNKPNPPPPPPQPQPSTSSNSQAFHSYQSQNFEINNEAEQMEESDTSIEIHESSCETIRGNEEEFPSPSQAMFPQQNSNMSPEQMERNNSIKSLICPASIIEESQGFEVVDLCKSGDSSNPPSQSQPPQNSEPFEEDEDMFADCDPEAKPESKNNPPIPSDQNPESEQEEDENAEEDLGIQSFYEYSSFDNDDIDINISLNSPETCLPPPEENSPDIFGDVEEPESKSIELPGSDGEMEDSSEECYLLDELEELEAEEGGDQEQMIGPDGRLTRRYKRTPRRHRQRIKLKRQRLDKKCLSFAYDEKLEEWSPLKHFPSFVSCTKWLEQRKEKHTPAPVEPNVDEDEEVVFKIAKKAARANELIKVQFRGGNTSDNSDEDGDSPLNSPANLSIASPATPLSQNSCIEEFETPPTPKSVMSTPKSQRKRRSLSQIKLSWQDPIISGGEEESPSSSSQKTPSNGKKDLRKEALLKCRSSASSEHSEHSETLVETPKGDVSELDGPSFLNTTFGFKHNVSNFQNVKTTQFNQYITTMSVEVHCNTRRDLLPDPQFDPILSIFVSISNDVPEDNSKPKKYFVSLLIALENIPGCRIYFGDPTKFSDQYNCQFFPDESALLQAFILLVREWDPEILVGYEIEKASLGYIMERSQKLGCNMPKELSRLLPTTLPYQNKKDSDKNSTIEPWNGNIQGRIVINLWRILRKEITVNSYTFESAAYHILHQRFPHFTPKVLSEFYFDPPHRHKALNYYKLRTCATLELMENLDLINRTSELARLFGIQFTEVLTRGSQYRVESMMLRLAKPCNLIPFSPTPAQRSIQRAPEFIPLILEPESKYYTDPVAVLDFQSLYPSMIIAYNYCFSTVLGRTEYLGSDESSILGCGVMENATEDLANLTPEDVHISPAGIVFVKSHIRKGIMPQMLSQILDTRLMVKKAMKQWSSPEYKTLQKILDSRQLGLKLIANVTYGYTSAHFSGRMPCVEIADSILSKGRETLQRAINLVQTNREKWGGRVVYGDTDSLFVLFEGKSREYAWRAAQDIVDAVTAENPKPVKLKLEKIYQPCILQTKKRYVGYSYESPDQKEPKYDAKGIETVRRDGCPAVKKILEVGIRTLFETNDPKELKKYIDFQFKKLFLGRVSLSDYTFARQFRGRQGYKETAVVPSLEIAKKMIQNDPRSEPLVKERVPYCVIYGDPKLPLIRLVRRPIEILENPSLRLNAHYYIEKVIIPALNRCFSLANFSIQSWYRELPRRYMRAYQGNLDGQARKKGVISDYFISEKCVRCEERTFGLNPLCVLCSAQPGNTALDLTLRMKRIELRYDAAKRICLSCSEDNQCLNFDCDIFHKLIRYEEDFNNRDKLVRVLSLLM